MCFPWRGKCLCTQTNENVAFVSSFLPRENDQLTLNLSSNRQRIIRSLFTKQLNAPTEYGLFYNCRHIPHQLPDTAFVNYLTRLFPSLSPPFQDPRLARTLTGQVWGSRLRLRRVVVPLVSRRRRRLCHGLLLVHRRGWRVLPRRHSFVNSVQALGLGERGDFVIRREALQSWNTASRWGRGQHW